MDGNTFIEQHARYKIQLIKYKRELPEQKNLEETMSTVISPPPSRLQPPCVGRAVVLL